MHAEHRAGRVGSIELLGGAESRREEDGDLMALWLRPRRWRAEHEVAETEREQEVYENSGPL